MSDPLLLLTYSFPPMAVPEAALSAKKLGGLRSDVDVVTIEPWRSWMGDDHSLDGYVEDRFSSIQRVSRSQPLRVLPLGRLGPFVRMPDQFRLLNRRMLRRAEATLKGHRALVTWSQWHSIHLVGLALKKRHPDLPWIVQMSDPWSNNPFLTEKRWVRAANERLEDQVLRHADLLMFPSAETAGLVVSGQDTAVRAKAHVVPHLFDPDLYPGSGPPTGNRLIFRYLGAFYGPRSPEPLFQGLALLHQRSPARAERVTVELVGNVPHAALDSPAFRSLPSGSIELIGQVDYLTSLRLMREAHVLLVIDAPARLSVFLPSKLVDYVGARRPIVGITPPGAARSLIERYGGWVADPSDAEQVAAALEAAVDAVPHEGRPLPFGSDAVARDYDRSQVSETVERLVDRVSQQSQSSG